MTQKRSRLPGWMTGATSAGGTSDTHVAQAPVRARLVSLLLRPTPPPLVVGLGVAASFIVAETLCVYVLNQVAPGNPQGVVFVLGVLVVSAGWGLGLAVLTSLASALSFDYVRNWPAAEPQNWVAIVVFLAVGLLTNTLGGVARSRAAEADQRRQEAEVLAEQQAGLRRVATLVARGTHPSEVFDAVADEMRRCMDAMTAGLWRFETGGELTLLAGAAADPALLAKWPVGTRTPVEGNTLASTVQRTGRPARMDDYENATGSIAEHVRNVGVRAAVGIPIIVDGRLWGLAAVGSIRPGPLPPDTEARMEDFADLVATSIANAATRGELLASRARIVAASDEARRRHRTRLARRRPTAARRAGPWAAGRRSVRACRIAATQGADLRAGDHCAGVSAEVQEISRGLHPAILSRGGLGPALKTLARRCAVPVDLDLHVDQKLPDPVEVAAYYVVAEGLTNAAKHARASVGECAHEHRGCQPPSRRFETTASAEPTPAKVPA